MTLSSNSERVFASLVFLTVAIGSMFLLRPLTGEASPDDVGALFAVIRQVPGDDDDARLLKGLSPEMQGAVDPTSVRTLIEDDGNIVQVARSAFDSSNIVCMIVQYAEVDLFGSASLVCGHADSVRGQGLVAATGAGESSLTYALIPDGYDTLSTSAVQGLGSAELVAPNALRLRSVSGESVHVPITVSGSGGDLRLRVPQGSWTETSPANRDEWIQGEDGITAPMQD